MLLPICCPQCGCALARIDFAVTAAELSRMNQRIVDIKWPKEFATRIIGSCQVNHLHTVGDLIGKTERELLLWPNFGKLSLAAVKATLLEELNLHLR